MGRLHAWFPPAALLYFAAAFAVLPGCVGHPQPTPETALQTAYPEEAPYGDDLDVVVVRDGEEIALVNREPRALGPARLWLNQRYMRPVERIAIGTGNALPLTGFYNRLGEHYPVGSFLRPERSLKLVLAELYDPQANTRYRLTVQPEEQPGSRE